MEPCKKAEVKNARIRLYPNIPRFPKQPEIRIPAPKQEQGFGVYGAFLCIGTMDLDAKIAFWLHEAVKTSYDAVYTVPGRSPNLT